MSNINQKKFKLIIFDIDSVLIDSIRYEKLKENPTLPKPHTSWVHGNQKWAIYKRPYLEMLLAVCYKYSEYVALWTKADKYWLNNVVNHVLPNNCPLLFKWTYKEADEYKRLSKVWDTPQFKDLNINETNTFIVEDTPENCIKNPLNAIIVPAFLIEHDPHDVTFPLLIDYFLNNILPSDNIQKLQLDTWRLNTIESMMKPKIKLVREINLAGGKNKKIKK